jgi:tRNA nucleotidyltransferase (CCA-adding enzyme)
VRFDLPDTLMQVMDVIRAASGKPLLVGGAVADLHMGEDPKDWDIEVYGLSMSALSQAVLEFRPVAVGKAFGILKLRGITDIDIDVSVPRRTNFAGLKDQVVLDPDMLPVEAARRRDFTINSLYYDPETDYVGDHFGGLKDVHNKLLRVTDPVTFVEDPIRCLRGAQLLARKCHAVELRTDLLCASLVPQLRGLPQERIYEEWKKLLMLAWEPSQGLRFLLGIGALVEFPEVGALVGCEQNAEWHPEGDVWEHTLRVVDAAAKAIRCQREDLPQLPEEWHEGFMFGALCHDMGKPLVTDEELKAHGHDTAGEDPARAFMKRLTNQKELTRQVVTITREHMNVSNLSFAMQTTKRPASMWRRLHNRWPLNIAGWFSRCDGIAARRVNVIEVVTLEDHRPSAYCWQYYEELGDEPIPKILGGKDLIAEGIPGGNHFGVMLAAAYEAQLDGETDKVKLLAIALAANPL